MWVRLLRLLKPGRQTRTAPLLRDGCKSNGEWRYRASALPRQMLAPRPHRSRIRPPWQFPLLSTVQQNETFRLTHRRFDCEDVLMVHTQMSVYP